jgi:hypothetical protein
LALISGELQNIFGPEATSMFIETTPKQFLFDGVEFCRDPVGIPQIVCMSIEERKSPTIVKTDDGRALRFSMFNHVSQLVFNPHATRLTVRCDIIIMILEKQDTRRSLRNQHGHQTLGELDAHRKVEQRKDAESVED